MAITCSNRRTHHDNLEMGSQADGIECQVGRCYFKVGEVIKANLVDAPIAR